MNLAGQRILVTGGARRIGAVIAKCLAGRGAVLLIHCHTAAAAGGELLAELPGAGHRLLAGYDFADPEAADRLYDAAGPVDLLVNNASAYRLTGADAAGRYDRINYLAPLTLMRRYCAGRTGGGAIVNVLDQEVLHPEPPVSDYLASRLKLLESTLEFALSRAADGIRVNAVAPGPMIPPVGLEHSRMLRTLATVPLGRRVEPDDLADAVAFLLSNDSITGAVLPVDCGQRLSGVRPG